VQDHLFSDPSTFVPEEISSAAAQVFDIRAACLNLLYAAYATGLEKPWEQSFVISDRQIEEYLGLDKRKDLTKLAKLTLIRDLVRQPCKLTVDLDWPQQGNIPGFALADDRLWHLSDMQYQFQDDEQGCKHLIGLTVRVRAGNWAQYFLNRQGCKERSAFYQYGTLPRTLLKNVMSIWQQHEGATRIMMWLLFKARMGGEQRIGVSTLMCIAYGDRRVNQAHYDREQRKYLIRTFESDLEALHHYQLKPIFDENTYPAEIQPLWAKLAQLPDDAEDALDFWIEDGGNAVRLTDAAPRGKWGRLMNARILSFELPTDWEQKIKKTERTRNNSQFRQAKQKRLTTLSSAEIAAARKRLNLSQRSLAQKTGKSQSWIRDIENGRFRAKQEDQLLLRKVLEL
jgi:DNA-binding transcriptional regulator YiaG